MRLLFMYPIIFQPYASIYSNTLHAVHFILQQTSYHMARRRWLIYHMRAIN